MYKKKKKKSDDVPRNQLILISYTLPSQDPRSALYSDIIFISTIVAKTQSDTIVKAQGVQVLMGACSNDCFYCFRFLASDIPSSLSSKYK